MTPGEQLRRMRELLGLPIRAVEAASSKLAERLGNPGYFIPISRLSDIETKGVLPSLYRLYSLAVIYRKDYREILSLFGIPEGNVAADLDVASVPVTHPKWKAKPRFRPRSIPPSTLPPRCRSGG